mgnify:CR=1 FL=1
MSRFFGTQIINLPFLSFSGVVLRNTPVMARLLLRRVILFDVKRYTKFLRAKHSTERGTEI